MNFGSKPSKFIFLQMLRVQVKFASQVQVHRHFPLENKIDCLIYAVPRHIFWLDNHTKIIAKYIKR